jgi:peptide-methionine (R)-S-oxide reductase
MLECICFETFYKILNPYIYKFVHNLKKAWTRLKRISELHLNYITMEEEQIMSSDESNDKVTKSDAEWRAELTPQQYEVTRKHGTEQAFTGPYWDEKQPGLYSCVCCGQALFESNTKFDSGTGWPSFFRPVNETAVAEYSDNSHLMRRVEVRCGKCEAHLGHVFPDGPAPTGLRYCMNGHALKLTPEKA